MVGIKVVISHDSTYIHAIFNAEDRRADTSFFMWNLPNQWLNPCPLHWKHRVLTTGPPTKSQDQRLLSQTNVSVPPGPIQYGKLQFPQVENGDNRKIQLLEMLWGLLGQCMECTDQCWGKVTKEGLSELQQLLVLATPICLWNCSFLSYQGLGFFFCIRVLPRPADKGCSLLESCTGNASKQLLKPDSTVSWMPLRCLPADPQVPPRWITNITAGLLRCHSQCLLTTSSAIPCSRGSAIRDSSFWLISQQRCLAATQSVF